MARIENALRYVSALWLLLSLARGAILYEGGTIISFNESTEKLEILRNASLLVEDDIISELSEGPISTTIPANTTRIDAAGKIISPGFMDTHHHLWQTAFRTIASNTTLPEYIQRYGATSPAIQHFAPEDIYLSQLMGSLELLHEGTTTVLDHAHAVWSDRTVDSSVNATFESGVRTFYAMAISPLPNGYTWDDQVSKLRSLAQSSHFQSKNNLVRLGLAYDSFFFAPEANISTLWNITKRYNLSVVTTHHVDGPWAVPNSPELLQSHGWMDSHIPIIFSHASFLSYEDARVLRDTNQYMSTTAESEFHYGHVNPNAHLIQDQASLGVDTHFTYSASMVQQARLWLQSLRWPNYLEPEQQWKIPVKNPMSVEQAFHLITRAGALALRRPDLGAIMEGSKADLVVYRADAPNMAGWSDPVAAIILHSDVGDIEDVLVDGKFVKRNGKLIYSDYGELVKRFSASASRIQEIWAETEWPPLEGGWNNGLGAPYTSAAVIDTMRGEGTGYELLSEPHWASHH